MISFGKFLLLLLFIVICTFPPSHGQKNEDVVGRKTVRCYICQDREKKSDECYGKTSDKRFLKRLQHFGQKPQNMNFSLDIADQAEVCATIKIREEFLHSENYYHKIRVGINLNKTTFDPLDIDMEALNTDSGNMTCQFAEQPPYKIEVCTCGQNMCNGQERNVNMMVWVLIIGAVLGILGGSQYQKF